MNNILIITHRFYPEITDGGVQVIYYYANQLVDLGYEVTVISKEYPCPVSDTKFKLIQVPNKYIERFWLFNHGVFFKQFDFDRFDHIILNQAIISIVAGKYFTDKTLSRCIPIVQGLEIEWIYKNKRILSWLFNIIFLRTQHYYNRLIIQCRKIVSVSYAHKNKMIKGGNLGNFTGKFQVVYTGIDRDVFCPIESDFRLKYHFTEKETILISVSRIDKMKGYLSMLSIFKQLIVRDSTFRWVIVGDGPFLEELIEIVDNKGLSEYIVFIGKKDRKDLNYYYSAADCFWLLSDYEETFGLVYIEAQACGIPAIGFKRGGVGEAIIHNKTGFVVSSNEECLNILLNRTYKNILQSDINDFIRRFDKIKAAKELIS
jgi:glycosyltransferase involved in cell wall biosynthesis